MTVGVIGILILIGILSVVSCFKCGNRTKWSDRALGLPTGSVRAILALLFTFIVIYAAIGKAVSTPPEWLLGIIGAIVGFYFGTKSVFTMKEKDVLEQIEKLRKLRDANTITDSEFDTKKTELLKKL